MAKKRKRLTAHEAAMVLLKRSPLQHIATICDLYALGTVVPKEAIPKLIKVFKRAAATDVKMPWRADLAVGVLERQLIERQLAEHKEKVKKKKKKKK